MNARTFFLLVALSGTAGAQQYTNMNWPPRDLGAGEFFGHTLAMSERFLAVHDTREFENSFVRVYRREGLNWLEDARLYIEPRTPRDQNPVFPDSLSLDGERVAASGKDVVHLFQRNRERDWARTDVPAPAPLAGAEFGRRVALSGDWADKRTAESAGYAEKTRRGRPRGGRRNKSGREERVAAGSSSAH